MKKRVLALALALILALSLLPFGALAADLSVTAPYRKVIIKYQGGGDISNVGGNGMFVFIDDDEVPELIFFIEDEYGRTNGLIFTLDGTNPVFLMNESWGINDLSFSEDVYKAFHIIRYQGETLIMVIQSDYYKSSVDPNYGQLYRNMCEFVFYRLADGKVKKTNHWSYNLVQLEDGRYFTDRSQILHNGKEASAEALNKTLNNIEVAFTVSNSDDTDGYPFDVLLAATKGKFLDVPSNAYYTAPVDWAVVKGITNGTSTFFFSPEEPCTRGQIVTFLWRAAGEPKPKNTKSPFKDVSKDAYYYNAVLWAVENGITNGTSAATFSPNDPCTRGQVVTFLHRNAGTPAVKAKNPFKDVKKGAYYYDAVLWAVENGITNGTSETTFSPNDTCTRGQIVTFLYRNLAQPGDLPYIEGHITLAYPGWGGNNPVFARSLSWLLTTESDTDVTSVSGSSDQANLESLASGAAQMCICSHYSALCAWNGTGPFAESGPYRDFSVVAALYSEPVRMITLDPDLQSVEDLRGKKVAVGTKDSSEYHSALDILAVYGMTEDDIQPVYLDYDEAVELLKRGEIDVAFIVSDDLAAYSDPIYDEERRYYSIQMDDEHIDALIASAPDYYHRRAPENTHFRLVDHKGLVYTRALLLARNDVAESDVQNVLSVMLNQKLIVRLGGWQVPFLKPTFARSVSDLPYHPGAIAYYESKQ